MLSNTYKADRAIRALGNSVLLLILVGGFWLAVLLSI